MEMGQQRGIRESLENKYVNRKVWAAYCPVPLLGSSESRQTSSNNWDHVSGEATSSSLGKSPWTSPLSPPETYGLLEMAEVCKELFKVERGWTEMDAPSGEQDKES